MHQMFYMKKFIFLQTSEKAWETQMWRLARHENTQVSHGNTSLQSSTVWAPTDGELVFLWSTSRSLFSLSISVSDAWRALSAPAVALQLQMNAGRWKPFILPVLVAVGGRRTSAWKNKSSGVIITSLPAIDKPCNISPLMSSLMTANACFCQRLIIRNDLTCALINEPGSQWTQLMHYNSSSPAFELLNRLLAALFSHRYWFSVLMMFYMVGVWRARYCTSRTHAHCPCPCQFEGALWSFTFSFLPSTHVLLISSRTSSNNHIKPADPQLFPCLFTSTVTR